MKHILPLTYKPKIKDVREGRCIQTIRPLSENKPKRIGDWVMFHGWEDKPYRSKWNWRTPYWKIINDEKVYIKKFGFMVIYQNGDVISLDSKENEYIANSDGFHSFSAFYETVKDMYGSKLDDMIFQIIRWNPKEVLKIE